MQGSPFDHKAIPPFAALKAFEAVGRHGGIRKAALALNVDHSVISRHVRGLEGWVGVSLIDRARGGGVLTPEGEKYHRRVTAVLGDLAAATTDLMQHVGKSRLNLWCVPGLASRWLLARLARFRARHPEIEIEFHPTDGLPDFAWNEADVDVRFLLFDQLRKVPPSIRSLEIARPAVFPVASPALLARLRSEALAAPADLLRAPLLFENSDEEWRLWLAGNGVPGIERIHGPRLWHAHLTIEAAQRGEGIALTNGMLIGGDLERGDLALVPIGRPVPLGAYVLLARSDRWDAPAIAKFRAWIMSMIDRGIDQGDDQRIGQPAVDRESAR